MKTQQITWEQREKNNSPKQELRNKLTFVTNAKLCWATGCSFLFFFDWTFHNISKTVNIFPHIRLSMWGFSFLSDEQSLAAFIVWRFFVFVFCCSQFYFVVNWTESGHHWTSFAHTDIPSRADDLPVRFSALWLFRHQPANWPACWHETPTTKGHGGSAMCLYGKGMPHAYRPRTKHDRPATYQPHWPPLPTAKHARCEGMKQKCMAANTRADTETHTSVNTVHTLSLPLTHTHTKACCAGQVKLF